MKKGFTAILLAVFVLLVIIAGGIYLLRQNKNSQIVQSQTFTDTTPPKQILSGQVQRLDKNLGLLLINDNPASSLVPNKVDDRVAYYTAGVYTEGKYQGYTRYIASRDCACPAGPIQTTFASKDGQSFILDGAAADPKSFKDDDYQSPIYDLDKTKISAIEPLASEHPDTIALDSRLALSKNSMVLTLEATDRKDTYGNLEYNALIKTDFSAYPSLKSPFTNLELFQKNTIGKYSYSSSQPAPPASAADAFIGGTTETIVVDSTGLAYYYTLTTPKQAANYKIANAKYKADIAAYENAYLKDHNTPYPNSYPKSPGLGINKPEMVVTAPTYNMYDVALPENCASNTNTLVAKNITDSDLKKIGTSQNGDIYVLKDKNHIFNKTQFDIKITTLLNQQDGAKLFSEINKTTPPTYEDYVGKNPLVFFKDYWSRWVILGEYDFHLEGGCGKPVVYLYPTKPTTVSVKFLTPISFNLTIPQYKNGWKVLANPNGTLKDLQPQLTNCSTLDSTRPGSEYAKGACNNNTYPYLYWAGTSTERSYPQVAGGWIIRRNNLSSFINGTLDNIGFNPKEKLDFTSYWLPKMLYHQDPYFKISFLQNPEMDQIAPMEVTPRPDHYFRYFLDFQPLSTKPQDALEPQALTKIVREGFTLVEWGGHQR